MQSLEKAVVIDARYSSKVESDPDFDAIRPQVLILFERLEPQKLLELQTNEKSLLNLSKATTIFNRESVPSESVPSEIIKKEKKREGRKEKRREKKIAEK